jgi:RNA polymerase sigma-70 factor (ECF subfamily)
VLVDRAHGSEVSSAALSAEDRAFADMSADSAMKLLLGLTPDQRSVVALRVIADLSLEETAGILGKSVGAVKALQKRGLARLRRDLEQAVSPPSDPTITGLT